MPSKRGASSESINVVTPKRKRKASWAVPSIELRFSKPPGTNPIHVFPSVFPEASQLRNDPTPLTKEHPDTVKLLLYILDFKTFPKAEDGDDEELLNICKVWAGEHGATKTHNLISLYLLCWKYSIASLLTNLFDELFCHVTVNPRQHLPAPKYIASVFNTLKPSDSLCRFLVDIHLRHVSSQFWQKRETEELPPRFLCALLKELSREVERVRGASEPLDICAYHNHPGEFDEEQCRRSRTREESATRGGAVNGR